MKEERDPITRQLRDGDPARDRTLDDAEARQMRARILEQVDSSSTVRWYRPAFASALAVMIAIVGWLAFASRFVETPEAPPATPVAATGSSNDAASTTEEHEVRQVQYTTPGGTRVIWTLDPDFEL